MNKNIESFGKFNENLNGELSNNDSSSNVICKSIAVDFAKWIAENKWYKQIRYDVWEKSGVDSKSTSELFDIFIEGYTNK